MKSFQIDVYYDNIIVITNDNLIFSRLYIAIMVKKQKHGEKKTKG